MDKTAAAACETTVAMDALKAANALARADLGDEDALPGEDGDQDTLKASSASGIFLNTASQRLSDLPPANPLVK